MVPLWLFALIAAAPHFTGQPPVVRGVVVDDANHRPLSQVRVYVDGRPKAITGANGEFAVSIPSEKCAVEIHRRGYYRRQLNYRSSPEVAPPVVALRRVPGPGEQVAHRVTGFWQAVVNSMHNRR